MRMHRIPVLILSLVFVLLASPTLPAAELWATRQGVTTLNLDLEALARSSITVEGLEEADGSSGFATFTIPSSPGDPGITFTVEDGHFAAFLGGEIQHTGGLVFNAPTGDHTLHEFVVAPIDGASEPALVATESLRGGAGRLELGAIKIGFSRDDEGLVFHSADVRLSRDWARALGAPRLSQTSIGSLMVKAQAEWVGGDAAETSPILEAAMVDRGGVASVGPDVIVGDLYKEPGEPFTYLVRRFGRVGTITSYSVGTKSCNVGTKPLEWVASTNKHPVIGSHLYRLKDGRFEQIGMSWLKHGFLALSQNECFADCVGDPQGDALGIHCSDPYNSQLNGTQSNLGPRHEVNASTGAFMYPWGGYTIPATIGRRLQVQDADIHPPSNVGALYFMEGEYVTADDALAGNNKNNSSYRQIQVVWSGGGSTTYNLDSVAGEGTHRENPAIFAWRDQDPTVQLAHVNVIGDGRMTLACKVTDLGGTWHYEYALYNMNSHRSAGTFTVPIPPGTTVTSIGFHDVTYHSHNSSNQSVYDGTDWPGMSNASCSVSWACTPYATNQNANAVRWGTTYNFRFDADQPPGDAKARIGLFRPGNPGTPETVTISAQGPVAATTLDCNSNGKEDSADLSCDLTTDCDVNGVPDECQPDCDADTTIDICEITGGAADCNGNAIPDSCELPGNDCNNNGVLDSCDIAGGAPDCNSNGRPDVCDLPGDDCDNDLGVDSCEAPLPDCDTNGTADVCEQDCNMNGVDDECDVASGTSQDCNSNGVPDECETGAGGSTQYTSTANLAIPDDDPAGVSARITVPDGGTITDLNVGLHISHTWQGDLVVRLSKGGTTVTLINRAGSVHTGCGLSATGCSADNFGSAGTLLTLDDSAAISINCYANSGGAGTPNYAGPARPNQLLSAFNGMAKSGVWTLTVSDNLGLDLGTLVTWRLILNSAANDCDADDVPDECEDDCNTNSVPDDCELAGNDCNNSGTPDACELAANDCNTNGTLDSCDVAGGSPDCNTNGRPDSCDLDANDCNGNGTPDSCDLPDCNTNGLPDSCDLAGNDCNGNGTPDTCELAGNDCNNSGVPDDCELAGNDCNSNGRPDVCDLTSNDCNTNGLPDECDLPGDDCNTNGLPDGCELPGNDCNTNGTLDSCDIAGGFSQDADGNGTPDECDPPVPPALLTAAVSRKGCDLALVPGVNTESRSGGIAHVRIAFDMPPGDPPGSASGVTLDQKTCVAAVYVPYTGAASLTGSVVANELVLTISPTLENAATYRINIGPAVTSIAGQSVEVRGLVGDVTHDGLVNAADRSAVVGVWTGTGFTCETDVTNDADTDAADRSAVVGAWTSLENCAP